MQKKRVKGVTEAYGKLNIGLVVGQKRADGFHDITSFFQLTGLYDTIEYEACVGDELAIAIKRTSSSIIYLQDGEVDLMEKAARLFSEATGRCFTLSLAINKRIPTGAGMGGGSSDAAAVINLLGNLFDSPVAILESVALKTGSDVLFFLRRYRAAFVSGRGEVVRECSAVPDHYAVLIRGREAMSTAEAYRLLSLRERERRVLPSEIGSVLTRESYPNSFEILYEGERERVASIAGERYYSLTGSGSSFFILSNSRLDASRIRLRAEEISLSAEIIPLFAR